LAQIEAQRIVQEEEVKRIEEIEKERERGIANREKQRGIGSNDGPKKRVEVDGRERVGTKMELVEKPRAVVPAVPPVQRSSGQNSPQTQRTSSQSSSQSQRLVPVVEILVKTRPNESELSKKKYQPSGYRSPDDFDDDDDEEEEDDDHYDNDYSEFVPGEEPFPRKHHRGRRLSDSGIGMITPQRGTGYGTPNAARSGYMSISKSIKKDPYKILSDLLEDVFEAEDALPANLTKTDLYENRYFDRLSVRSRADDKVLLCRNVVVKLSQTLKMCRTTRKPTDGLIRGRELAGPSLEDWNVEELIRILKLLGRVTQEIDGLVVFNDDGFATRNATASTEALEDKGKPVKKKRKATKVTEGEAEGPLQEEVVQTVLEKLGRVIDAVLAGECIVTLLTAGDLPKPLYSEDMIAQTIESVALAVTDVVIPVLQALAGDSGIVSSVLASATSQLDPGAKRVRDAIYTVASSAVRFLHRLPRLINHPSLKLQEALVYKITQMVVQLVFMADPVIETKGGNSTRTSLTWKESLGGPSGTRLVKMEAIEVLKTLFSNQRAAEREEILTEILNGTAKVADLKKSQNGHRTRKGKTIHFVSALLLELMQTCSSGIHELLTEADVSDATTGEGGLATETNANSMIIQNTRILAQIMEDIDRSATHILKFLVNKISGANVGKQKSSFEANYRAIFEAYLEDQLEVLYTPEFPAAALSLGITARTFIPLLDDTKPSADNAAIRGIAIDHLGALVSTLRQFEITYNASIAPPSLRTIVAQNDLQAWSQLRQSNEMLLNTLRKNASQNGLYNSAADVMTAQWMLELYRVAKRDGSPEPSTETARSVTSISQAVDVEIKRAARKVGDDGVFGQAKDDLLAQADHPCITVEMTRPLQSALGPAFKSILTAMSAPIVAQRTKAIRALGMAAAIDPAYLIKSEIRNSLQDRISDSSPAVRDAAIDLIGKYIPEKPDVAFQYYASISDRIADTGLAVRKRVIKLFKIIHGLVNKSMIQVDICCKLVLMVDDEEDTVKELALATLTDLWFPLASAQTRRAGSTPVGDSDDKQAPEDIMQVVVNVVARYANDMNQIEQVISEVRLNTASRCVIANSIETDRQVHVKRHD
jgi:cohesin loading factor subunit SCC2